MKARAFLAYTLDPFARELNADVSLFCFFFFFHGNFLHETENVLKSQYYNRNVWRATLAS